MSDSLKNLNASKHRKGAQFHNSYKIKSASHVKSKVEENKSRMAAATGPKLPSNWEKYDRNIDETLDGPRTGGIEFNALSALPTHTAQFLLKQDRVFLPRSDCTLNPSVIFDLDMQLIHLSLATIPFYKRVNIDESLFSDHELDVLNMKAQDANTIYHAYLATQTSLTESVIKPDSESNSEISIPEEIEIHTSDLGLLDCASNSLISKDLETKELEDWLDNVV